jgi:glycosyltransferase involved in cell wall biosynthesis
MDTYRFNFLSDYVSSLTPKNGVYYITQSGTSGYANAAKGYIYDLIKNKVPIKVKTFDFDDSKVVETSDFDRYLQSHYKNDLTKYKTIIVHATPDVWDSLLMNSVRGIGNSKIIGRTVWEFEKLPPDWVSAINKSQVHIVSVPTNWNKVVFEQCGVTKPVIVEPHVFVDFPYSKIDFDKIVECNGEIICGQDLSVSDLKDYYKFYTIGQFIPRKGISETIEAFCKTFTKYDKVVLFVKTFGYNHSIEEIKKCKELIQDIISSSTQSCGHAPIVFLYNRMTYDDIQSLHDYCDCYVQLTRTEGFGLGIFEAYNKGKKVIVTNYGGQSEYLGDSYEGLVDFEIESVKEKVFYTITLDETYFWAKPSIYHACTLMRKFFERDRKTIHTVTFMDNFPIKLSSGWYDVETHQSINFRWMNQKSTILVTEHCDCDFITLVFANHFTRKQITISTIDKNDVKGIAFEKVCESGERCYAKIPVKDVTTICVESDVYYCPYESGDSEDKRKLSIMVFSFEYEKNVQVITQSIENVPHNKDSQVFKPKSTSEIVTDTTAYFGEGEQFSGLNIMSGIKHGILMYLPNLTGKHEKTLDNLSSYTHSRNGIPIVVYTDGDIDNASKYPFEFIKIDPLPKMYDGMVPVHYKYATWAFFEGIKIAQAKNWEYFFCYEWDCKIGKDRWYDILWQEHLNWPYEPIMTGTPVFKCPLHESGNLLQGSMDYRYRYSKECGLYMNIEHVNPHSLYTNGALTFYNTKETARYFDYELKFVGDSQSNHMDTITSWDLEIGIRLFKQYGEQSFEKVGWLPSSYSGCGDYYYNQSQRESMLSSGQKVVIHQYKYL